MLREYDENNPETYEVKSTLGNMLEMIILPVTVRENLLAEISAGKTTEVVYPIIRKLIKTIDGRPIEDVLPLVTHQYDLQVLYNDIVAFSWLPEDVAKNLQPSPESSEQEKDEGAMNHVGMEDDSVSITQPI